MDSGVEPGAKAADYLFLMRPIILIPVWTFYLLGAHHGRDPASSGAPAQSLLIGALSFTLLIGAAYIVNQITDRESDRLNRKLFLISDGIVPVRTAWIETCMLGAMALAAGAFVSLPFFFLLLFGALLGAAYSIEPLRLKRRPGLDVAANAVGNGIINTLAGWIAAGGSTAGLPVLAPYPLAVASVHLATTLADIGGDSGMGLRTTGVAIGARRGLFASAALMAAAAGLAWAVGNRPAFYASLLSLPCFISALGRLRAAPAAGELLLPAKVATLVFTAAAGIIFWPFIPFVIAVLWCTRIYYRRRFGIVYPSL